MQDYPSYQLDEALQAAVRADGLARAQVYRCPLTGPVLGRGSKAELELQLARLQADGVPIWRRAGGGCSVWLDPGNLVVALARRLPGLAGSRQAFTAISTWLASALASCGIAGVQQRGISDLCQGDRKVGGACIHRSRDFLYYSTTLLVQPELEAMERYLQHPPREPDYRQGRPHRAFVAALSPAVDDLDALAARLARALDSTPLDGMRVPTRVRSSS